MTRDEPSNHKPGPTLLPGPIASTVSLATRSTSLAIRLGSFVGGYGLEAARFTTLSSLELARGLVEVVLTRAGKDTLDHAKSSPLAAADAENVLERSLENLHSAVIQVAFWTSASFRLTGTTLTLASDASQLLLSSLDKLLGSTDSSRAVASIITLMRREFRNPVTGTKGERVGVLDLTLALSALAYLQQACRKLPEEESRRSGFEEVIWDVVVLNDGDRVDIDDKMALQRHYTPTLSQESSRRGSQEEEEVLSQLRSHISQSLPPDAQVTISNAITTVQTITVVVEGCGMPALPTPPGAEIVETSTPASRSQRLSYAGNDGQGPYRIVYKIERDKFRAMTIQGGDDVETGSILGEIDSDKESLPSTPMQYDPASGTFLPLSPPSPPPKDVEDAKPPSPDSATQKRSPDLKPQSPPAEVRKAEPTANQKRQRLPASAVQPKQVSQTTAKKTGPKKKPDTVSRSSEKKAGLKQVLKEGSQSISNIWSKDGNESNAKPRPQWQAPGGRVDSTAKLKPLLSRPTKASQERSIASRRSISTPEPLPRSSSRASYISLTDRRRESMVSQSDSYPVITGGRVPSSPILRKQEPPESQDASLRPRQSSLLTANLPSSPMRSHRRNGSHAPSIYSLATNDSQTSLVLSSYYKKSTYSATDALNTLRREGFVDGTFPEGHLLPNITRYMRFSSACYGSHFLKLLGISNDIPKLTSWDGMHQDVRHFAHHTESNAGNILLASFVDPEGGTDSTGATGTGVPLVHYISLDHEAKAVVLACRGTLGFEDVMVDMTCDYDDLVWKKRSYKVHKGVHASARRLLYGDDGRVLVTLKEALLEFSDYGLVLCGHSLGGGVTALLGVMLAEANPHGPGFVTAPEAAFKKMLADGNSSRFSEIIIPAGRRIHVYAYGSPGVMSPKLRKITRGLITTVVHGNDLVPHLSLGVLHDFQALALAFKSKENATRADIRRRMWAAIQDNLVDAWSGSSGSSRAVPGNDDDKWMLPALAVLRENFTCERLVPPGEVFVMESYPVLRREAFLLKSEGLLGRPATRVILKYVRDVEGRFAEPRFGTSMLTDHSPANYENALNKLRLGVVE